MTTPDSGVPMRFILMHKTNAHWEAGAVPGPELIGRVGRLMGELASASVLLGAEGLRATSQGVRLSFSQGKRTVTHGPFEGENELPAGFDIVSVGSIDEAIEWATRQAEVLGDIDVDIRPVTEAWDIGLAPKPEGLRTRRYMVLRKASAASEAGLEPSPAQRAQLTRITEEARQRGVHLASESMRPSGRGRRYKNSVNGQTVVDGPFAESKELIAGYVIVSAGSLADASRLAERYLEAVEADEVDLRELEDATAAP